MSATPFLRLKKLTGHGIILAAARHNRRAILAELEAGSHIDASRSHLNYALADAGNPEDVADRARIMMRDAGIKKLRKDAVKAIEIVFSLPVEQHLDQRRYFEDCLSWASGQFGGADNVLAADVHLDEAAPHCHVLLLPLINGKMVGSDLAGGKPKFKARMTDFHESVASRYGLKRAPAQLRGSSKSDAAASVLRRLREMEDPILRSAVWPAARDAIELDPRSWFETLGLEALEKPAKPMKSMTDIFIGSGAGPKREPDKFTPRGFESRQRGEAYAL